MPPPTKKAKACAPPTPTKVASPLMTPPKACKGGTPLFTPTPPKAEAKSIRPTMAVKLEFMKAALPPVPPRPRPSVRPSCTPLVGIQPNVSPYLGNVYAPVEPKASLPPNKQMGDRQEHAEPVSVPSSQFAADTVMEREHKPQDPVEARPRDTAAAAAGVSDKQGVHGSFHGPDSDSPAARLKAALKQARAVKGQQPTADEGLVEELREMREQADHLNQLTEPQLSKLGHEMVEHPLWEVFCQEHRDGDVELPDDLTLLVDDLTAWSVWLRHAKRLSADPPKVQRKLEAQAAAPRKPTGLSICPAKAPPGTKVEEPSTALKKPVEPVVAKHVETPQAETVTAPVQQKVAEHVETPQAVTPPVQQKVAEHVETPQAETVTAPVQQKVAEHVETPQAVTPPVQQKVAEHVKTPQAETVTAPVQQKVAEHVETPQAATAPVEQKFAEPVETPQAAKAPPVLKAPVEQKQAATPKAPAHKVAFTPLPAKVPCPKSPLPARGVAVAAEPKSTPARPQPENGGGTSASVAFTVANDVAWHVLFCKPCKATPATFSSYKERQQIYAQMKRHVHQGKQTADLLRQLCSGDPSEHGVSDEVVKAWKQAVDTNNKTQKNQIFLSFVKAGKDWGKLLGCTLQNV